MPNSPSEPRWLPPDEVVATNLDIVSRTGEPHLVRDRSLLESACAAPRNLWSYGGEEDLVVLALSLLFAVARNHPFLQGNKRTAFLAALQFLELNGWRLSSSIDSELLAEMIVAVLEGATDDAVIAELLEAHLIATEPD